MVLFETHRTTAYREKHMKSQDSAPPVGDATRQLRNLQAVIARYIQDLTRPA